MISSRLDEVRSRGRKEKKAVSGAGPAPWLTGPMQDALSLQSAPRRSFLVSKSALPGGAGWAVSGGAAALARGQHVPGPRSPLAAAQPAAQILREAASQAPGRHRDSAESLPPGPVAPSRKRTIALRPPQIKKKLNWNSRAVILDNSGTILKSLNCTLQRVDFMACDISR